MASDRIALTVPARSEYAKTARMTAAELASRIGMSYDEVDDVRIAADEAFVYACARVGEDGEVTFLFEVEPASLGIAVGPFEDADAEEGVDSSARYAAFILESVCDEFDIEHEGGTCMLTLLKRSTTAVEG